MITLNPNNLNAEYEDQHLVSHVVISNDQNYANFIILGITLVLKKEESEIVNKSGIFRSTNGYSVRGSTSIITQNGVHYVLLGDDFQSGGGPDLNVYLTKGPAIRNIQNFIDLGDLKSIRGEQRYSIPASVDISQYTHVVIYCVGANGAFGIALLNAPSS